MPILGLTTLESLRVMKARGMQPAYEELMKSDAWDA